MLTRIRKSESGVNRGRDLLRGAICVVWSETRRENFSRVSKGIK